MTTVKSILWLSLLAVSHGNAIRDLQTRHYDVDTPERSIFDYRINGVKIDMKIVPATNESTTIDDGFPKFPVKEIGHCMAELSLTCAQKRIARFLDIVGNLPEITLFGQSVKLVKLKEVPTEEQRTITGVSEKIDKSIDDFFDTFALRISLPRRNGKKSQIDVAIDDTDIVEGRGEKGGGGKKCKGGKKSKCGGGGGSSGCKKMMMMMMMGLKAKMMGMIGMAAMKGMMFSGMSLMITKMMLLSKYMSSKGMFGGGGGGGHQSQQLKEIVLLTKAGSSGGHSASSAPSDSYGAPPPTGGSGGYDYSGGSTGGWGRSFDHAPMTTIVRDYTIDEPKPIDSTTREVDEPMELKLLPENKWNTATAAWSYTTESGIVDQVIASQSRHEVVRKKTEPRLQQDQSYKSFESSYAQGWKNHVAEKNKND